MKAIYKHIAFAALALGVAACTQEDDFTTSYQSDPNAVRITAQVGSDDVTGGFTRSNPLGSTADDQAKFNANDAISVAAGSQAAVIYTLADDAKTWNPETGKYLKWESETMDVTAYYPVTEGTSATDFTVPTSYTSLADLANADYMTFSGTASKGTDKSINLAMERKMVRIVVDNITFNNQFAEGYEVQSITVHSNTNGYANGEVQPGDIEISAFESDDKFYALLAPTEGDANTIFLTVIVTDVNNIETPLPVKGVPTTEAGNSYNLSLTVGKNTASVTSVSVKEWTGSTITGGEAIELKATCEISGTTATLTVPELAPEESFTEALETLSAATGVTTITVDGTLTEAQQTALATALDGNTTLKIVFEDMNLADLSDDVKWMGNPIDTADGAILQVASCGENAQYMIYHTGDANSRTLSIKGTGAMANYDGNSYAPWVDQESYQIPDNITKVEIAEGITTIGDNTFGDGYGIASVTLPVSITSIGWRGFASSLSLTSITIPKNVTSISSYAFGACRSLESVTILATTPPTLGTNVFNNCSESLIIYVPSESVAEYKSKWSDYTEKIEPIQ